MPHSILCSYVHTCAASGMSVKETGSEWISRVTSLPTTSWFLNLEHNVDTNFFISNIMPNEKSLKVPFHQKHG